MLFSRSALSTAFLYAVERALQKRNTSPQPFMPEQYYRLRDYV